MTMEAQVREKEKERDLKMLYFWPWRKNKGPETKECKWILENEKK